MGLERLQKVEEIFQAALDLVPEHRAAYLDEACADDLELRREVEDLVSSYEQSGSFIETAAIKIDASIVARSLTGVMVGQSISHYRIMELIGEGGMGEVYLAHDTRLGRRIALKLLPKQFTLDVERVHRFEQEARAASALNHPNIVTIHEVGEVDSSHFIATEFIEGVTLREHMSQKRMDLGEVLDVGTQIASALAAAHEVGVMHRDIKPENIMLRRDGYVKVLDFGLAKLASPQHRLVDTEVMTKAPIKTDPGIVMGTARYMSPEQARGLAVDVRTDVWSLAVVLYEMLAGRTPFEGETRSHVIVSTLEKEPPPISNYSAEVPAELQRIISKALRKNTDERYQTASELCVDLQKLKQEQELGVRLVRSIDSDASARVGAIKRGAPQEAVANSREFAWRTARLETAYSTSSAEYLISGIKRHKRRVASGVIILAVFVLAAFYLWRRPTSRPPAPSASVSSIAVLPFKSLGSDTEDQMLSFGMTETLIARLSTLRNVVVRPTSSVRKFASLDQDPVAAGRELKVDAVLESSIQRIGDRVRVNWRVIRVSDGSSLSNGKIDERIDDLFAVQDRVSEEVARTLVPQLTGKEKNLLAKRYTQNGEAYRLYMNGVYQWNRANVEGWTNAVEYFNRALEKDPEYALAYAGLADTYTSIVADALMPKTKAIPKARQAVMRALELDATLAEAHVALGRIKAYYDWDWDGAESEFRLAIELDPNSAVSHREYSGFLATLGRSDQAIAESITARDLDPLSPLANFYVIWAFMSARRYDEAIAQSRQVLATFPQAHYWMGLGFLGKGQYHEAALEFEERLRISSEDLVTKPNLAYAYAMSGRREKAEKTLDEFKKLFKQHKTSPYPIAIIYAGLGEKDQAFVWLEAAYRERSRSLWGLKINPAWDGLRSDQRFADLLRRMGLD